MARIFSALIVGLSLFMFSCTDPGEKVDVVRIKDYQPNEVGKYWVYQLDSITYSAKGNSVDTSSLFSKEEIIRYEKTDLGHQAVLEISQSNNPDSLFKYERTERILFEGSRMIFTENNLQFIKLVEPVQLNSKISWDGNSLFDAYNTVVTVKGETLNMYRDWAYYYDGLESVVNLGNTTYESVLNVIQVDWKEVDVLSKRFSQEKYAKNIGLIQKIQKIYNTQCNDCGDKTWEEKAEEGYSLVKTLVNYGG